MPTSRYGSDDVWQKTHMAASAWSVGSRARKTKSDTDRLFKAVHPSREYQSLTRRGTTVSCNDSGLRIATRWCEWRSFSPSSSWSPPLVSDSVPTLTFLPTFWMRWMEFTTKSTGEKAEGASIGKADPGTGSEDSLVEPALMPAVQRQARCAVSDCSNGQFCCPGKVCVRQPNNGPFRCVK